MTEAAKPPTLINIRELAMKAWGKEWNKPDVAYEFSKGRTFESTDLQRGGIYQGTGS